MLRKSTVLERAGVDQVAPVAPTPVLARRESRVLLSLFFVGAIVWGLHLTIGYALASLGCPSALSRMTIFGGAAIPVLIGLITIAAALISAGAGLFAYREWQQSGLEADRPAYGRWLAQAGIVLNSLFTILILFETVPVLLVRACG